jgi:TusA-related sulfurtransferase
MGLNLDHLPKANLGLKFISNNLLITGFNFKSGKQCRGISIPFGGFCLKERHDYSLDLRNTIIPFALLDATEAFRQLKSGETIEILVGDPDTQGDLLKVLPSSLYELIEIRREESFFRIFLKKEKDPPSKQGRENGMQPGEPV